MPHGRELLKRQWSWKKPGSHKLRAHAQLQGWLQQDFTKYEVICIIGDDPNNPVYAYMSPESANWVSDDSPDVYQDWLVYKNETAFFKHTGKGLLPNR